MIKKFLLVLFLSTMIINSYCQEWAPVGAKWHYSKYENLQGNHLEGYVLIESVKDSTISGIACKMLTKTYYKSNGEVIDWGNEFTYKENGIVYFYINGIFKELYNFNKNIGDTIAIVGCGGNVCTTDTTGLVIISSKSDTLIGTDTLKQYATLNASDTYWNFNQKILETIGCLDYMFPLQTFCGIFDVLPYAGPLRCYQDSNLGLIQFTPDNCDTIIGINDIMQIKTNMLRIYPNPVTSTSALKLNYQANQYTIKIYTATGRLIQSKTITHPDDFKIYNAEYQAGIYLLCYETNDKRLIAKFVVN